MPGDGPDPALWLNKRFPAMLDSVMAISDYVRVNRLSNVYFSEYRKLIGVAPSFVDNVPEPRLGGELQRWQRRYRYPSWENFRKLYFDFFRASGMQPGPMDRLIRSEIHSVMPSYDAKAKLRSAKTKLRDAAYAKSQTFLETVPDLQSVSATDSHAAKDPSDELEMEVINFFQDTDAHQFIRTDVPLEFLDSAGYSTTFFYKEDLRRKGTFVDDLDPSAVRKLKRESDSLSPIRSMRISGSVELGTIGSVTETILNRSAHPDAPRYKRPDTKSSIEISPSANQSSEKKNVFRRLRKTDE
jgi:hypothetical protein